MHSPTTARAAILRRAGTLAAAAVLVGAPAATALAEPSPSATSTMSATATPAPTTTSSAQPTTSTGPEPSATTTEPTPSGSPTPSESTPAPPATQDSTAPKSEESATPDEDAAPMVGGGTARSFGPAAATGPATSSDSAMLGAGYLQRQLEAADYLLTSSGYPDPGLTADAILALDAAGTGQDAAAQATARLASDVVGYTGFGDPAEVYAGSVAKLLNVAVAQGVDPTAFGGVDLVATLQGLEQPNGRFADTTAYDDYSNTFGQSFAIIGLHRASAGPSTAAVDYLLDQQCPGGGFQLYMSDSGCSDDASADPDATAMAVQALLAAGGAAGAASDGLDDLTSRQSSDGGVGGAGLTSSVNANSTGLAGQAFLAGGRSAQARLAVTYLEALQYDCSFPAALRGGIAYDTDGFEDQRSAGAGATPSDQDRRSTSQGLMALAGTPLGSVSAAGSDAEAPEADCAEPTTTPTDSASPSASATSGASPTSGAGSSATAGASTAPGASGVTGGSSPTGSLAQTGADLLWPVGLGLALIVLGAVAVLGSRRRGAHA